VLLPQPSPLFCVCNRNFNQLLSPQMPVDLIFFLVLQEQR
jgi:hypothetical protein